MPLFIMHCSNAPSTVRDKTELDTIGSRKKGKDKW